MTLDAKFCFHCGEELPTEVLQLKYYFSKGYEYNVNLEFLSRFHGVTMSLQTLKNRLKLLGLKRRTTNKETNSTGNRWTRLYGGVQKYVAYTSLRGLYGS